MKRKSEIIIRYRSLVGIVCMLGVICFSVPTARTLFVGFFLIIGGMVFRAWSSGFINKNTELATQGPYSLTRNPLYFGNFLIGLGFAIAGNTIYTYLIFFAYYLLFFPYIMWLEHNKMKEKFGKAYEKWAKNSNSFFTKIRKVDKSGFNITYYMKNKEYRVLYFSLFFIALLIIKTLFLLKSE